MAIGRKAQKLVVRVRETGMHHMVESVLAFNPGGIR